MAIIDTTYEISVNGEIQKFATSLTEAEFYSTLDAVYGAGNYKTLSVTKEA